LAAHLLAAPAMAAPGDLDPSFGTGGYVQIGGVGTDATGLSLLPDGRIAVAILGYQRGAILQFLANGGADVSFGTGGRADLPIQPSGGLARQQSGKLIAFGEIAGAGPAIARVDSDGSVDPTFGVAGVASAGSGYASSVALQSSGNILAAYWLDLVGTRGTFVSAVARHLVDGAVDPSFGAGGSAMAEYGRWPEVAVDAADRILLARLWDIDNKAVMLRLTAAGARDASFGQGGAAFPPTGAEAAVDGVAVQADGRIVTIGWGWDGRVGGSGGPLMLVRYLPNGTPDPAFGSGGVAQVRPPNPDPMRASIAVQPDGRIIVAANLPSSSPGIVVLRLLPDGSPDATFGNNGTVTTAPIYFTPGIMSIAIQPDGKILVLTSNGILLRYLGGGGPAAVAEVPSLAPGALALLAVAVAALAGIALRRRDA
jgi:uncharacterized delta-60 repeat protein